MNLSDAQTRALETTLGQWEADGLITNFDVRERHVMVAFSTGYWDGNPELGYDDETTNIINSLNQAMSEFGLQIHDAGGDTDGEYILYS